MRYKKYAATVLINCIVFIVYLAALLRITVFRSSFSFAGLCSRGSVNFIPFADLVSTYKNAGGLRFIYLFFGNIVWFVPFGTFVPTAFERMRGIGRVIFAAFLLSLFIEVMQFVFGSGVSEIDDLILNTTGGAIGYGLFALWETRRKRCRQNVRNA